MRKPEVKAKDEAERQWLDQAHQIPCVLCCHLGFAQSSRTEAHHAHEGVGLSQRSSAFRVSALCGEHHRGSTGVHGLGTRGLYRLYRIDELDLVDMTVRAIFARLVGLKRSTTDGN